MAGVITEVLHHLKTERRSAAANFHITLSPRSSSLSCTDSISNSNKRPISASNNLSKIIISNNMTVRFLDQNLFIQEFWCCFCGCCYGCYYGCWCVCWCPAHQPLRQESWIKIVEITISGSRDSNNKSTLSLILSFHYSLSLKWREISHPFWSDCSSYKSSICQNTARYNGSQCTMHNVLSSWNVE